MKPFIQQNTLVFFLAIFYIVAVLRAHVGCVQTQDCRHKRVFNPASIIRLLMEAIWLSHIKSTPIAANSKVALAPRFDVAIYFYRPPTGSHGHAEKAGPRNGRIDIRVLLLLGHLAYTFNMLQVLEEIGDMIVMLANPHLTPAAPDHESEPTYTPHRTHINLLTDNAAPQRTPFPVRGLGLMNMDPNAPVPEPVSLPLLYRHEDENEEEDDFYPDPPEW